MKISVVVPIYNESLSLRTFLQELLPVLKPYDYEVLFVNDGSTDDTKNILKEISSSEPNVKIINFRSNFGQTAALSAGFTNSSGEIVVSLDGDLENDPKDITKMIEKLNEGYDVVSGWRIERWGDRPFTRRLPSIVANWLISIITGLKLNDYGCTLKVYRKDVIKDVMLYGEMHRFIPAYAFWGGARVSEIPVHYRKRRFGQSHYGISRIFRVILDLIVMRFLYRYMNKPMHFFGGIGFISLAVGIIAGVLSVLLKMFDLRDFVSTPLPIFSALFIIVGVQMMVMGVIGEMIMRTYYESQNKRPYSIKDKINF